MTTKSREFKNDLFEVYEIKNLTNNMRYIGVTKNGYQRKLGHFRALKNNTKCNRLLKADYDKDHQFEFNFIDLAVGKEEASQLESYYINLYRKSSGVYNLNEGGIDTNKGYTQSDYAKQVASQVHSQMTGEKNSFYDKHHTKDTKNLISQKLKGRMKGVKKSDETRHKMSKNNHRRKEIMIDNVKYHSLTFAEKELNINRKKLSRQAKDESITNIYFIN